MLPKAKTSEFKAAEELPVGQEPPVIGPGEIAERAGRRRGVQAAVEQEPERRDDQRRQHDREHRDEDRRGVGGNAVSDGHDHRTSTAPVMAGFIPAIRVFGPCEV